MKILIVGGQSSLGQSLLAVLQPFADMVTAGRSGCDMSLDLTWPVEQLQLPQGIDVVINTAAHFGVGDIDSIVEAEQVNALGTLNLLEAVRAHAPEAVVIYSSTNKVYGDLEQYQYRETDTRYVCVEQPNGFDELTPLDFQSPYGCSKGSADQYLRDFLPVVQWLSVVPVGRIFRGMYLNLKMTMFRWVSCISAPPSF